MKPETPNPEALLQDYRRAEARRRPWEALWRDCAVHALPGGAGGVHNGGAARIYDATAADAAEQLAASLLAELTPPFERWVGFEPGSEAGPGSAEMLDAAAGAVQGHLDRSAFAVEMHQALLDLVVFGTGCLLFEESALGRASAFRFAAVPLAETVLEEGAEGRLDRVWRRRAFGPAALRARFPRAPARGRSASWSASRPGPAAPTPPVRYAAVMATSLCWKAAAGARRRCWPRAGSPSRPSCASAG